MNFEGRTAVVTGAANGIGKATAIGFAEAGANVALLDIDRAGAERVAKEIEVAGGVGIVFEVDVADPRSVQATLRAVRERFGSVDALANVAAIYPHATVLDVTEELWDRVLGLNLRGVFFTCQEAISIMLEQGRGAIVNVASGAAFRALEGLVAYSASKAGLVGMGRVLALECARKGIRINTVAPGHTPSFSAHQKFAPAELDAMAESLVPGRFMTAQEQANAIIWLCSDEASGCNGAVINVNGGNYMP